MKEKFKSPKFTVQLLATLAMLVALRFVLGKFTIDIIPKQLKLGPSFIVNTIIGSVAGPWLSAVTFGIYDVVAYFLGGSSGGSFSPVFTLIEIAQGFCYGLFFYVRWLKTSQKKDWLHTGLATLIIMLIGTFIFTPIAIKLLFGTPIIAQYLQGRWLKIFEIPIRVIVTMLIIPKLQVVPELRRLMGLKK